MIPVTSAGRTPEQTRPEVEPHCTSTFLCAEVITKVLKLSLFLLCINLNSETETLYVTKMFYCPLNKRWGPASSGGSFHSTEIFTVQAAPQLEHQNVTPERFGRKITLEISRHWTAPVFTS